MTSDQKQPDPDPFAGQRNIWMLWLQGRDVAPDLVKACHRSWQRHNPGWRVQFLSADTLDQHLGEDFRRAIADLQLPPQHLSDLIRLHLIARHGGVWTDADTYCTRPLDSWLPANMSGGFFAFRFAGDAWLNRYRDRPLARWLRREPDRMMDNWFFGSVSGNALATSFLDKHLALLTAGEFGKRKRRRGLLRLALLLLRRNPYTSSMLSRLGILRAARTFPYFIFHYHFARAILTDAAFDAAWRKVPAVDANGPLRYANSLHEPADPQFLGDMAGEGVPIFKLHWKQTQGRDIPGSRYRWLLDQPENSPS
jgi:hypothetical protein